MKTINKIIHPCDVPCGTRKYPMFCKITMKEGIFSISGVIGPTQGGNAMGGCGQIDMDFYHKDPAENDTRHSDLLKPSDLRFSKGWTVKLWYEFLHIWKLWHLNDLQAKTIPADVIEFIEKLPETDRTPNWV